MGGVSLAWGVASDVGLTRRVNEDAVLAEPPVFLVADGMGGHDAGDVASGLVIEHLSPLGGPAPLSVRAVTDSIDRANDEIVQRGADSGNHLAMGTTVAGAALVENGGGASWLVFNIGDSRIYRQLDGVLTQVSVDHSYVQELMDSGVLDRSAARTHPQRNVVTRALGMESGPEVDVWFLDPEQGERLIICSDGLSSEIDDDAIVAAAAGLDAGAAAQSLVHAALEAGGRDNVSVLVVDVVQVDDPAIDEGTTAPRLELDAGAAAQLLDPVDSVVAAAASLISVPPELVDGAGTPTPDATPAPLIDGVPRRLTAPGRARGQEAGPPTHDDERNDQ